MWHRAGRLELDLGGTSGTSSLAYLTLATAASDADADGLANPADNCPFDVNPVQSDGDGDGIGDACDLDLDDDGVLDTADNCPTVANADQAEANLRGLVVTDARVDAGPTIKRFQPKDRGRAHPILKRTSHLTVAVDSE